MTCTIVRALDGSRAIVCSRRKTTRCGCGQVAPLLCDWKVPGKRSGTCDRPVCRSCTTSPAPDKDLCPEHAAQFAAWAAARRGKAMANG